MFTSQFWALLGCNCHSLTTHALLFSLAAIFLTIFYCSYLQWGDGVAQSGLAVSEDDLSLLSGGRSFSYEDRLTGEKTVFLLWLTPITTNPSSNNVRQRDLYTVSSAVSSFSTELLYAMWQKKTKQIHYGVQDGSDFLIISLNFPMCVTGLAQRPVEKLLFVKSL